MALKHLSVPEMVDLTSAWVDPSHADRTALASVDAVVGILPLLDAAHADLLATQVDTEGAAATNLIEELASADVVHDAWARACSYLLRGHEQVALAQGRTQDVKALQALHDTLFPDGLRVVNYSYREESGHAVLLASRLSAEDKTLLASLPISGGTLADAVESWIQAGTEIGTLEQQRTRKRQQSTLAGRLQRARNRWIRVMQNLRSVLELSEATDKRLLDMLKQVEQVEQAAEARARPALQDDGEAPAEPSASEDGAEPVPT